MREITEGGAGEACGWNVVGMRRWIPQYGATLANIPRDVGHNSRNIGHMVRPIEGLRANQGPNFARLEATWDPRGEGQIGDSL